MLDRPTLIGPRLVLRSPIPADADTLVGLGRDPEIMKWFGMKTDGVPPLDLTWAQNWLSEIEQSCSWIIARDDVLIGTIRLMDVWLNEGRARVAMGLQSSRDTGQGFGQEALNLVLGHAFDTLGLHRVGLRVMATNDRAIRCYLSCGFVEEGREREAAWTPEGRVDDLIMGLLAPEWRARS